MIISGGRYQRDIMCFDKHLFCILRMGLPCTRASITFLSTGFECLLEFFYSDYESMSLLIEAILTLNLLGDFDINVLVLRLSKLKFCYWSLETFSLVGMSKLSGTGLERPKSQSLTRQVSLTSILAGFMSLCIMFEVWTMLRAHKTLYIMVTTCSSENASLPELISNFFKSESKYSITRNTWFIFV